MTRIEHRGLGGAVLLALDYIYTANDLPVRIYESGSTVGTGITISTTFVYDRLRRLKEEQRCRGTTSCDLLYYDLEYWYDAGGNRIQKIDYDNGGVVYYTYDIAHPSLYGSNNNRLMKAETRDGDGSTVATTWYYYTAAGNVRWIVSDPPAGGGVQQQYMMGGGGGGGEGEDPLVEAEVAEGEATEPASLQTTDGSGGGMSMLTGGGGGCVGTTKYTATRFEYAKNGQTVTYVLGEEWCWDRNPEHCPDPGTYKVLWAREFRYDGARARYMNAPLDPVTLAPYNTTQKPTVWSDYDGDEAYGDFTVSGTGVVTNTDAYQPGLWRKVGTASEYLHSDMLGTLRQTTGSTGTPGTSRVFTAFGERLPGSATDRFGYVGAWGYQDTLDSTNGAEVFPFLHVGARYYDPSSGRFLQRDLIGIRGGKNVYQYARGIPTLRIDPLGLSVGLLPGPQKKPWDPGAPRQPGPNPRPPPQPAPPPSPPPPDDDDDSDIPPGWDPFDTASIAFW